MTETERAKESIKEYRKGYGQSQLPTDCIIQLMMGHAKSEQLLIQSFSNQREQFFALLKYAMPTNYKDLALERIVERYINESK
jgi:hypothetical protein